MRIRTGKTKNGRLFYVIKTYYDSHGVEHTITVEKLGNENDIKARTGRDPDQWAKEYVAKLNEEEKKQNADVTLSFSQTKLLSKEHIYEYHAGYLFLQKIYYELGLDKICRQIAKRHSFQYDLNSILSRLLYGRILEPCSKKATFAYSKSLLEKPNFEEHHVYRALDVLCEESDFIQQQLYKNSFVYGKRHTGVLYYDCSNFFFEIEQQDEDGLRKFGKSKENRPLPIVEMGLFMDGDGIPLGVCIHPGNTNEQKMLKPIEQRILSEYGMSKFIVCTDAGLASKANRKFNSIKNRAFIVTSSIKKLKREQKEWALSPQGWYTYEGNKRKQYDISKLITGAMDEKTQQMFYDTVFYKERWVDQGSFEEKLIVTFSLKYQHYQRSIRNGQMERARKAIENGTAKGNAYHQNDYRRLVEKTAVTDEGEVAGNTLFSMDMKRIAEEETYDGFYALNTNLDDDPGEIVKVNHQRWQIEECFRIMKSEFKARPAHVSTDTRIQGHFLTCYLALVLYRYLEKRTGNKYTCEQLLSTLRGMHMREVLGEGYLPSYTRTDITDTLHEAFGFRTDYQILTAQKMKSILKSSKDRNLTRKK